MTRLLVLLLVLLLVYLALQQMARRVRRSQLGQQVELIWRAWQHSAVAPGGRRPAPPSTELVRCSGCGAYVPEARVTAEGDRLLCSSCCGR